MNSTSKTTLQALGYGLAGAAAAAIANETARRARPSHSPLGFLSKRMSLHNPFGRGPQQRTLAGALLSTPLFHNFGGGRSVKRSLLRSALLGLGAGLGSLALPQQKRSVWRGRGGNRGSKLMTVGRLLAGGLVAAAASRLFNKTSHSRNTQDRHTHNQHTHDQFD